MMKTTFVVSVTGASAGGTLAMTWKDCGDAGTHGTTTNVVPAILELGKETPITGSGSIDKDLTGGTYDLELVAGGGLIDSHFTGNNCEAKDFKMPLGIGSLTWKGVDCPLKAGPTNLYFSTKLAAVLPAAAAKSDMHLRMKDQDGENAICTDLHYAKQQTGDEQFAVSDEHWEMWKQEHGRVYDGTSTEAHRRHVFNLNMVRAAELQKLNPEAEFGATKFSDWTEAEFSELLNYKPSNTTLPEADLSQLPVHVEDSKDWTGTATSPVKDQGSCGSCWAFSATEQIESDLMLQHGSNIVLAPQQLVDCRKKGAGSRRFGCTGGNVYAAYEVIEANGGMMRESDYPYKGWAVKACYYSQSKAAAKVSAYEYVGKGDESAMKRYIGSTGPLSVCVAAGSWHSYKGGVMTSCGTSVDHCVQVVGYGDSGSSSYWKVRNSWGTSYGEDGHLRIQIGSNLCKINSEPSKVTVEPLGQVSVVV